MTCQTQEIPKCTAPQPWTTGSRIFPLSLSWLVDERKRMNASQVTKEQNIVIRIEHEPGLPTAQVRLKHAISHPAQALNVPTRSRLSEITGARNLIVKRTALVFGN